MSGDLHLALMLGTRVFRASDLVAEQLKKKVERELMSELVRGGLPLAPIHANSNQLADAQRIDSTAAIAEPLTGVTHVFGLRCYLCCRSVPARGPSPRPHPSIAACSATARRYSRHRCSPLLNSSRLAGRSRGRKLASGVWPKPAQLAPGLESIQAEDLTGKNGARYDESRRQFQSSKTGTATTTPRPAGT